MTYKNIFDLKGRVAVVTGGSGFIGKELSRGLQDAGAFVIVADIDGSRIKPKPRGGRVIYRYLDITNEESISDLIDFLDKRYRRIDIWVNSAYPRTSDWEKKFEDISLSSWKKNTDMHLSGYFICCKRIAEYMKRKKQGSIINFASIYGFTAPTFSLYKGTKMIMPACYSAIKGGIINFTRYLAAYYGKYNVRVNCVSPGGVYDRQVPVFVKRYSSKVPLGRMAEREDIVGAVIYLSSDASKYVTGHNLIIDGGFTII